MPRHNARSLDGNAERPRGAGWAQLLQWAEERRDWTHTWRSHEHQGPLATWPVAAPTTSPVAAAAPTGKEHPPSSHKAPSAQHCPSGCLAKDCFLGEFGAWNSVACGIECTKKGFARKRILGDAGSAWCPSVCGAQLGLANSEGEAPQICKMEVDGKYYCGLRLEKTEPYGQVLAYTEDLC